MLSKRDISGRIEKPEKLTEEAEKPEIEIPGYPIEFSCEILKFKLFQKDINKDDLEYLYRRYDIAAHAVDIPDRLK